MSPWEVLRHMGAPIKVAAGNDKWELFNRITVTLSRIEAYASKSAAVLVAARSRSTDAPYGRVWQSEVKRLLDGVSEPLEEVDTLKYQVEDLDIQDPQGVRALAQIIEALTVPRKASVAYAISDLEFSEAEDKETYISYNLATLKVWSDSLDAWVKAARNTLRKFRYLLDT